MDDTFNDDGHLKALFIVASFSLGGSYLIFKITVFFTPLRVNPEQEETGLDLSQHGEEFTTQVSYNGSMPDLLN